MKDCRNCKHYKSKSTYDFDQRNLDEYSLAITTGTYELFVKCELGYNDKVVNWWKNNQYKPSLDPTIDTMDCCELTDGELLLIDMNKKLDELSDLIDKKQ